MLPANAPAAPAALKPAPFVMPEVSKRTTDAWESEKPSGLYHLPAVLTTNHTLDTTAVLDAVDWRARFTRAGPKARKNGAHMFAPGIKEKLGAGVNQRMIVDTPDKLLDTLELLVANAKRSLPEDSYVQAFRAESLACMRYLKKWDLGFHFDSKVDVEEAGVVFMGCFGAPGLTRTFRFVNPFTKTKWDLLTRPGDLVIFHSDCYNLMHGSLPLECDGPFYSITMRRSDGCGYIMGGKRGSSAVAAEAAAKRFKHGDLDCQVVSKSDVEASHKHKIENYNAEEAKAADAAWNKYLASAHAAPV